MFFKLTVFCFALIALAAPAFAIGEDMPAWLGQAAAASAPAYKKDVPAVVLHKEETVTIGEDQRLTTVTTYAVRVLTREGRAYASAYEFYDSGTGKVRDMRAWLIRPGGSVKKYGKNETVDEAADLSDLYNELRVRKIMAVDEAEVGAVFGYQVTTEDRALFPQTEWSFQGRLPTLAARYTMNLPAGWRAASMTFNNAPVEPSASGSSYTWELRNLPPIEPEPASPTISNLAPRLVVSYGPEGVRGAPTIAAGGRSFESWVDVSKWYSELSEPQAAPDDAIAAKARELTATTKTELERIQAIGRFVQNLQYISIQIGIGGYRPHPATEVFAKKYGDCKDKANLMRALLRAVKIQSYMVLIYAGDRTYVREQWASPTQFNHCIIAIKVSDETKAPTVVAHPVLGRLLIFDATDSDTPVGDLPGHEQGSLALVAAGEAGALLRMPATPPEANLWQRQTEVNLTVDGSISATIRDHAAGQSAARARRMFNNRSRTEFAKVIERWITTNGATLAKLSKVEPRDNHTEGRFTVDIEFTADRYAQLMQNRLLVFKPAVVTRSQSVSFIEPTRRHPVVLESEVFSETVRVHLPAGFEVDELPAAVKIDVPFGAYTASYEVKDGQLLFTRTFVQRASTIPAEQYGAVRDFFNTIRASEEAPVVLIKT